LSDDAAKQLRDLLKAAEDQRAKRADLERQMLLSDLAKTIALLKKVSAGDPAREKAVDQFEAAFRRLGAQLDQARADAATSTLTITTAQPFSMWVAKALTPATDPTAVPATGFYPPAAALVGKATAKGQPEASYEVKKVDGDLIVIAAGRDAGIAEGRQMPVFRLQPKPMYLGTVTILAVTPTEAVGRVAPKGAQVRAGDEVSPRELGATH